MNATLAVAAILLMSGAGVGLPARAAQSPPSPSKAPAALDACALVTRSEAAAAVGEPVGEPKRIDRGQSATSVVSVVGCEYESAARHSIHVSVWRPSGDSAATFLQVYKTKCMKKELLPGVGDLACWYSAGHSELQILKGATLVIFQINRDGNATAALTTVAKGAAARLP